MITITAKSVRRFGDLPKEEYIDDGKIEDHIKVANNNFLTIFDLDEDIDIEALGLSDLKESRLNDSIIELKKRLTLISILPFVNTMYIDGYAKYAQGDTLTSRFYRPDEVKGLIKENEKANISLIENIKQLISTTSLTGIVKDKSGLSFTSIGGSYE